MQLNLHASITSYSYSYIASNQRITGKWNYDFQWYPDSSHLASVLFLTCGTGKQKYIMTIIKGMSGFRQHQIPFVSIKPTNGTYNEAGYTKTFVLPCADSHYELKIV